MEAFYCATVGLLTACGVYLMLRARTFTVILGLTLVSYAVSLFLLGMGRLSTGLPPIIASDRSGYADPLPQALVLTAIVISFAMTAFTMVLALRSLALNGSDHVDGEEPAMLAAEGDEEEGDEPDGDSANERLDVDDWRDPSLTAGGRPRGTP